MKKNAILILLILAFACKYDDEQSIIKVYYENGNIKNETTYKLVKGDTIKDGYFKEYYLDGKIKYYANVSDNLFHGELIGYYPNGNIEFKGNKYRGMKDGFFYTYYDNEKPLNEKVKIKEKWHEGKRILNHYLYDVNGNILEYNFFNPNGELAYSETYNSDGKIIESSGNKVPLLLKYNEDDFLNIGDTLKVVVFSPFPPNRNSKLMYKIEGIYDDWKQFIVEDIDTQIYYENKIQKLGEYVFEIKYSDSLDSKDYFNEFSFVVKDTIMNNEIKI